MSRSLGQLCFSCTLMTERKRRGSGDPSGLQNRRELALLALVSSTLTRFRQFLFKYLGRPPLLARMVIIRRSSRNFDENVMAIIVCWQQAITESTTESSA